MKSPIKLIGIAALCLLLAACGGSSGGSDSGKKKKSSVDPDLIAQYGGIYKINPSISSVLIATTEFTIKAQGEMKWSGFIERNFSTANFVISIAQIDERGDFSGSFDIEEFYETIWFGLDGLFEDEWIYEGNVSSDGSVEIDLIITAITHDGKIEIHHSFVGQLLQGAGVPMQDMDYDGIADADDNCPKLYNPTQLDTDGDGIGAVCGEPPNPYLSGDRDGDQIHGLFDNCPAIYNPDQLDSDGDSWGDQCDPTPLQDRDGDGIENTRDNCPGIYNPDQADSDQDFTGDVCESSVFQDSDADNIADNEDNCPYEFNPAQADSDGDGKGDECDVTSITDNDADGILNGDDNCPNMPNLNQFDADGDGIGDLCDPFPGV